MSCGSSGCGPWCVAAVLRCRMAALFFVRVNQVLVRRWAREVEIRSRRYGRLPIHPWFGSAPPCERQSDRMVAVCRKVRGGVPRSDGECSVALCNR